MLASIDILVGLSLVMLVASLATMLVTQALIAATRRRGHHLLCGLTDLLAQLHPGMTPPNATTIAAAVLKHPLIRGSERRLATVIKREEFIKLLFELGSSPPAAGAATPHLPDTARKVLEDALRDNGVADPAQALSNVRMLALELERTHPELATSARQTIALTQEARSQFVAKVNAWFDQTMDRVTERFTVSTRAFTFISAVAVVAVTQLDAASVINRLAMDDSMRQAFVAEAVRLDATAARDATRQAAASSEPPTTTAPLQTSATTEAVQTPSGSVAPVSDVDRQRLFGVMREAGLLQIPRTVNEWVNGWSKVSPGGVVLSVLLLSLGAPFWFNALSSLLRLRSVVAQKDDTDRTQRQLDTSRPGTPGAGGAAAADAAALSAVAGERGDLAAIG